jgi:undecaprenyl-diphosphatase
VAVVAVLGALFAGHTRASRLDAPVDAAFRSSLGAHPAVLEFLAKFGDLPLVTVMTAALVLGCAVARRWRGAALAAVAVPVASGLTEGLLKPGIGRTLRGFLSYPSGHATSSFALATVSIILLAAPSWPRVPAITRRVLMLGALLLAVAVPSAMVGLNLHYFTDIVGGAALGTGTALLTALLLDIVCGSEWWRARTARPSPDAARPRGSS